MTPMASEQPDGEQQRVTRQDGEQPALGEDDERDTPQGVRSEEVDQELWIHPGRQQHRRQQGGVECGHRVEDTVRPRGNPRKRRREPRHATRGPGGPWGGSPSTAVAARDPGWDAELLADGDRRNVLDEFRYRTVDAIVAELDTRRHPLRVAIQNWEHDFNIGSIVRTANAFNVAGVHILGRRRWNRRGAMVTDRYLHVHHHADVASFAAAMAADGLRDRRRRQPAGLGCRWRSTRAAGAGLSGLRLGGARSDRRAGRCLRAAGVDQPVRLDPFAERRGRGRHRHVPLGAALGGMKVRR